MKIDDIKARRDFFEEWLENYQTITELAPAVKTARDRAGWDLSVISTLPDDAVGLISLDHALTEAGRALDETVGMLQPLPRYDASTVLRINSISSSASSAVVQVVGDVSQLDSPEAQSFAQKHLDLLRDLQRPAEVRELVRELIPSDVVEHVIEKFEATERTCALADFGGIEDPGAAVEMRNLLDAIGGEVIAMARNQPKENMTLQATESRLLGHLDPDSWQRQQYRRQLQVHDDLKDQLSPILKRRAGGDIQALWARVMDHLTAWLSVLKAAKTLGADQESVAKK
jgi:hypothetical protein